MFTTNRIGVSEAQVQLPAIVRETVESGQSVILTDNGRDVVEISPVGGFHLDRRRKALRRILNGGAGSNLTADEVRTFIDEGRH